jgi:hypothetical protein
VRKRYVNGAICRVGYLADLRLDASARGRFRLLRDGYRFFHEQTRPEPADFYFTSIAADNDRSIRLLERGLPDMPAYKFASDFVTLLIPVPQGGRALRQIGAKSNDPAASRGLKTVRASKQHYREMVSILNSQAAQYQFASHWNGGELESLKDLDLSATDFQLVMQEGHLIAGAALWDQRQFKQTVIRGYAAKLSFARPWINLAAGLCGRPQLPAINSTLAFAFVSPLAVRLDDPQSLLMLIKTSLGVAAERGLEYIVIGFSSADPRLAALRNHFRCREYQTRLYAVKWPDSATTMPVFDGRQFLPDIALL